MLLLRRRETGGDGRGEDAKIDRAIADYPNPDLAIEVDVSPSKIDRPGIYAALRVAELWRFDGDHEQVIIERLGADGSYHGTDGSDVPADPSRRGEAVGGRRGFQRRVGLGTPTARVDPRRAGPATLTANGVSPGHGFKQALPRLNVY